MKVTSETKACSAVVTGGVEALPGKDRQTDKHAHRLTDTRINRYYL